MVGFEMRHVYRHLRNEAVSISHEERLQPFQPQTRTDARVAHHRRASVTRDDVGVLPLELEHGSAQRRLPPVEPVAPDEALHDPTEPDASGGDDGQYHEA